MSEPSGANAAIKSQAVIVFTLIEDEHGATMQMQSFGSPHGGGESEEFADTVIAVVRAATERGANVAESTLPPESPK